MAKRRIIIGARASLLSVAQAKEVSALLKGKFPQHSFSLKKIVTSGDKSHTSLRDIIPPQEVRDKHRNWQRQDIGIFVKEIEEALLTGKIDLAVHSLKDLPCTLPEGLELAAVTKRMDPRDCIIFRDNKTILSKLKKGAHIGTSSLRRRAQLLRWRGDLQIKNLRGNLDTRLRKLTEGEFDAIIVAMAGVIRLGVVAMSLRAPKGRSNPAFEIASVASLPRNDNCRISCAAAGDFFIQPIPASLILPAPGQGALGIEIRQDDTGIKALAERINDRKSFLCISCERAFLEALGAGCRLPLGALAEIKDRQIHLQAVVLSSNGRRIIRLSRKGALKQAESLGRSLAKKVLEKGGRDIMKVA